MTGMEHGRMRQSIFNTMKFLLVLLISLNVGCANLRAELFRKTPSTPSDIYERAVSIIERDYIDPDGKPLKLDTTNSPNIESLLSQLYFSELISPNDFNLMQNPFTADIGIKVVDRGNKLKIIGSYDGSPASRVGINYDDNIIEIDNQSLDSLSPLRANLMLLGQPGSEVSIKILGADNEIKTYKLVREVRKIDDYSEEEIIRDGIGYIQLLHFENKTPDKLKSAVKRLLKRGMVALVLDIRGNSGGLLSAVKDASQLFIKSGGLIGKWVGNNFTLTITSKGWTHYIDFPVAVLIDTNTENGAEIMAAALKENNRAVLIGEKTAGIDVIRSGIALQDGSILLLRTHRVLTPQGNKIDGVGVQPDIEVSLSREERKNLYREVILTNNESGNNTNEDKQLEAAVSHLLKQIRSVAPSDTVLSVNE